jgi:hypothetical protein
MSFTSKCKLNKKGFVDPFQIASRMGYYILALMVISVLFLFFAVLIQGSQKTYYKNTFGTEAITLEEQFFTTVALQDSITSWKYQKVIDIAKVREYLQDDVGKLKLNHALGIYERNQPNALAFEIFVKDRDSSFLQFE